MSAYVFIRCPACDWRSGTYNGGPSGRMMGVLTAGNNAEDEFDKHYEAEHLTPHNGERQRRTG